MCSPKNWISTHSNDERTCRVQEITAISAWIESPFLPFPPRRRLFHPSVVMTHVCSPHTKRMHDRTHGLPPSNAHIAPCTSFEKATGRHWSLRGSGERHTMGGTGNSGKLFGKTERVTVFWTNLGIWIHSWETKSVRFRTSCLFETVLFKRNISGKIADVAAAGKAAVSTCLHRRLSCGGGGGGGGGGGLVPARPHSRAVNGAEGGRGLCYFSFGPCIIPEAEKSIPVEKVVWHQQGILAQRQTSILKKVYITANRRLE